MTMKSVGKAALAMVEEVRRQFNTIIGIMEGTAKPDYRRCVEISTNASLREMVGPGCLVMLTPLVVGIFLGVQVLSGVLAGSLVSGIQMAISASNTGGAWDNGAHNLRLICDTYLIYLSRMLQRKSTSRLGGPNTRGASEEKGRTRTKPPLWATRWVTH